LYSFKDEKEAIHLANDTTCGLAAYFYTKDVGRIFRVSERLDYGMLGINAGILSTEVAPFGGMKESGLGREGSKYGVNDYTDIKYMCLNL
jgi:succinate-semialdehyde dehydrogenase/glutarate-semialdehyde dehydrogenase